MTSSLSPESESSALLQTPQILEENPKFSIQAPPPTTHSDDDCPHSPGGGHHIKDLGGKSITFFGALVYIINSISGPGMLALPYTFLRAGWLLPIICLFLVFLISGFASTLLCEAMALVPKNHSFELRFEFCNLIKYYFGKRWSFVSQIFYNLSLLSLNIASIIVCAQVLDHFIVWAFGKTFALEVYPHFQWVGDDHHSDAHPAFDGLGDHALFFSLGLIVSAIICIPLGYLNLEENIYSQYVSWVILVVLLFEFYIAFFTRLGNPKIKTSHSLPATTSKGSHVLGVILFSYAFPVTIPSLANEKKPSVSLNKSIWWSAATCTVFNSMLGILGALAFPSQNRSDILSTLVLQSKSIITQLSAYAFTIGTIGLGIPIFSIMVRYNLYVGQVTNKFWAGFFGVIFPFLISPFFYQGKGFLIFVNWSGLIINGVINFVVPFILYIKAIGDAESRMKGMKSDEEKPLLSPISKIDISNESNEAIESIESTPTLLPDLTVSETSNLSSIDQDKQYPEFFTSFQTYLNSLWDDIGWTAWPKILHPHPTFRKNAVLIIAGIISTALSVTLIVDFVYLIVFGKDVVDN